ncbi:MAG: peptidoglycan editing factor PgeF [Pedobacter sp.]|nr:peptidoglycan editing factor PgeF [Pedobacter sp.]
MSKLPLIKADWPAPPHVHAVVSTRAGGVSVAPWDSLNLGMHVADDAGAVRENRARLLSALQDIASCSEPQWLNQVHGVVVADAEKDAARRCDYVPDADATFTSEKGLPCVVMTADCLPVFFTDKAGTQVAVAHAGWRGLCDGVLEATLVKFPDVSEVLAWMGPAIGPEKFEVGEEVRAAFVAQQKEAEACFKPGATSGKWLADIYALARLRLNAAGVQSVSGGGFCTVTDEERFFSYRRDGKTGRMASIIWIS